MQQTFRSTMDMLRYIGRSARIKHGRGHGDFLADRIIQSATEPTLLAMVERLTRQLDADVDAISPAAITAFTLAATSPCAPAVLAWLRDFPRLAAMLTMLKTDDYFQAVAAIEIEPSPSSGAARPDNPHDINLRFTCLSPLAHGADIKAGNATLYRRMQVLASDGSVLQLPYYAGNALRGELRDILADDLVRGLGLAPRRDRPPIALWFFHVLYAGGALEEGSAAEKALKKRLGGDGAVRAHGIHEFRDTLPGLSLLGCALGNRVLCGRARFADLRPVCRQWGTGDRPAAELFEWLYLTRREDHEEHTENHSMIATTEALRAGTVLLGGIDMDIHATALERSALARGLQLLAEKGYIGAENRRGLGRIELEATGAADPGLYRTYVENNKDAIMEYLTDLGAIDARREPDSAACA